MKIRDLRRKAQLEQPDTRFSTVRRDTQLPAVQSVAAN